MDLTEPPLPCLELLLGRQQRSRQDNKVNLQDRIKKFDIDSLPKTIRDAVHLTRALGERYLFVGAVCIVQPTDGDDGDNDDRTTDLMGNCYGNALCSIAATGAAKGSGGCFHE
ncbi:hypothetical protein B0T25DRAFT_521764 [Lasiosphaeria hispida]|uniref:Heterokaryon incompatibility domain-containing protein n=1 Tax=Lasiosphaeria hispida TaxID=260671 RepID=A0AAJ0H8B0_9PEZI|nr:hypothetical protein B0T25DRAFT_521764 [Lasiosphaeria hispida]